MQINEIVRANTRCVAQAAKNLGITYKIIDDFGNVVELTINRRRYYFVNCRTPFNAESISSICQSKIYSYQLLKHELPMPLSKSYIDPKIVVNTESYVSYATHEDIVKDIRKSFNKKPVIVKMNAGAQGHNVFLCKTPEEIRSAMKKIFNKRSRKYGVSLLAQEYIAIQNEYRVIVFKGKVLMVAEKITSNKNKSLSPLHNDDARIEIVKDKEVLSAIKKIVTGSPRLKNRFAWNGLDVSRNKEGKYEIIELNAHPGFTMFVRDNGDAPLVKVFEKTLRHLQKKGE